MKAQLLTIMLLFSVMISSAFTQNPGQSENQLLPTHPLEKTWKLLEKSRIAQTAHKSTSQNFQLNQIERQLWRGEDWAPFFKTEYTYDSAKRVQTLESNYEQSEWVDNYKEFYTYENDLLTNLLSQYKVQGEFVNQYHETFTYQQFAGQPVLNVILSEIWDSFDGDWLNESRTTVVVESGMLSEIITEEWEDEEWVLYDRTLFEESDGNLIETMQMYDHFTEGWEDFVQVIYPDFTFIEFYNRITQYFDFVEDGRSFIVAELLPDYISFEWDDFEEEWIPDLRQVTEASTNLKNDAVTANLISYEIYDYEDEIWFSSIEYLIGYAGDGKIVNFSIYSFDMSFEKQEGSLNLSLIYMEDYIYDENNLLSSILEYGENYVFFFKKLMDENIPTGRSLLTWEGVPTSAEPLSSPLSFRLDAAYPNPFNPSTVIPFQLTTASNVTIQVYDMLGRNVSTLVNEYKPAGEHTVRFDGSGLSSGVYMIRMVAPGLQQTRSVTLLK